MTHFRTTMRSRLASTTLLSLVDKTASGKIHRSRHRPIGEYPSINVLNGPERLEVENDNINIDPATELIYRRFQDFMIEVAVKTNEDPDTELDDLLEDVEGAMALDYNMLINSAPSIIGMDLVSTTFTSNGQGVEAVHVATLTYRCEYRTTAGNPATALR